MLTSGNLLLLLAVAVLALLAVLVGGWWQARARAREQLARPLHLAWQEDPGELAYGRFSELDAEAHRLGYRPVGTLEIGEAIAAVYAHGTLPAYLQVILVPAASGQFDLSL